jgi:hypothetical protein
MFKIKCVCAFLLAVTIVVQAAMSVSCDNLCRHRQYFFYKDDSTKLCIKYDDEYCIMCTQKGSCVTDPFGAPANQCTIYVNAIAFRWEEPSVVDDMHRCPAICLGLQQNVQANAWVPSTSPIMDCPSGCPLVGPSTLPDEQ